MNYRNTFLLDVLSSRYQVGEKKNILILLFHMEEDTFFLKLWKGESI